MFEHNFEENRTRKVVIEDTKALVFKKLIEYLYTGVVSEIYDEDITVDLLVAADKYHILALKEDCSIVISRQLTTENAVPMMILAYLHLVPSLYENSVDFIAANSLQICSQPDWMEMMILYPKLCYQATQHIVAFLKKNWLALTSTCKFPILIL